MGMDDPAPGKQEANMGDIIGLVHMNPDDEPIFILTKEHDFGAAATAVDEEIGAAPCAGEVLAAFLLLTEAKAGGTGDDLTSISKAAAAASKLTGDLTMDMSDTTPGMNTVGSVRGVAPVATEADRQFAKGDTLYVYTDAKTSRSAGKYLVTLICKKI